MFYTAYERASEAAFDRALDSCGQDTRRRPSNVRLPVFCHRSRWCEQGPLHAGECDKLELFFQPYSDQPHHRTESRADMELQPEKTDNPNSPFFSWNSVGDKIEGLYIDYEKKAGQYSKPQLTLKLRDGNKKFVNCGPVELQKRLEGPAERGELDGLWITITFIGEEDSGKENKKKLFKVEAGPKPAVAAQHRTVQATREPGDDSDQEDPFDGPNVRAKAR